MFTENVNGLYLLWFLLTGNQEKAEECFVAGIGESVKGNYVFEEWAHSWARRTIIQSVIRLIAPREHSAAAISNLLDAAAMDRLPLLLHAAARAILQLAPLERFVFVISVGYRSDVDRRVLSHHGDPIEFRSLLLAASERPSFPLKWYRSWTALGVHPTRSHRLTTSARQFSHRERLVAHEEHWKRSASVIQSSFDALHHTMVMAASRPDICTQVGRSRSFLRIAGVL